MSDPVNHPPHYLQGPDCPNCGRVVEAICITEHYSFAIGNALKYLLRHEHKGTPLQDLEKSRWYIDRAIDQINRKAGNDPRARIGGAE